MVYLYGSQRQAKLINVNNKHHMSNSGTQ